MQVLLEPDCYFMKIELINAYIFKVLNTHKDLVAGRESIKLNNIIIKVIFVSLK